MNNNLACASVIEPTWLITPLTLLNALTFVEYLIIAGVFHYIGSQLPDVIFSRALNLTALFVASCGLTHLMAALNIHYPWWIHDLWIVSANFIFSGIAAIYITLVARPRFTAMLSPEDHEALVKELEDLRKLLRGLEHK